MQKKKEVIKDLNSVIVSCQEAINGTWDTESDEGKEGFDAMIYLLEKVRDHVKDTHSADEISVVATIISDNLFDGMMEMHFGGTIETRYLIAKLARKFVEKHTNVKEWEEFCDKKGASDWEEYILQWTRKELKKLNK